MLPFTVAADTAAPSPVTGVAANVLEGQVVVQWNPVASDPIEYYRVYYSSESILENDGLYDDFESTEGDETTLTFIPPRGGALYVAVIAVSTSGQESAFFTEEARVELDEPKDLAPTGVFKDGEQVDTPPPADTTSVRLLKAEVTSPEEIVVTFSSSITVDRERAPEGLSITDADDKKLQIKSIVIDAKTVTIKTVAQKKGAVYNVAFQEPFEGRSGQALDENDRSVLVTGHSEGEEDAPEAPAPVTRTVNPQEPPDLANVTITPQMEPTGAYTITLEWDPLDNSPGDLYGIVAYQTRDGRNFGPPSLLPTDVRGVTLNGVTPGFFGIYLQVANVYGFVSPGIFQYSSLPVYIPGYGLQGNLSFGSTDAAGNPVQPIDIVDEPEEGEPETISLEVITEDSPVQEIEGVNHAAAYDQSLRINWKNAVILAGGVATVLVLTIGGFVLIAKKNSSTV